MTATTTATTNGLQAVLNAGLAFVKSVINDGTADEKTALKPVLDQFATGLTQNPDEAGLGALLVQLETGALAAQVQVKSLLLPQIGTLLQAQIASW